MVPISVYDFLVALEDDTFQSQPAKPNTQADDFDVREFILNGPCLPVPKDAAQVREWILVNGFEFPVPVGADLEDAMATSLDDQGFTEVRVNSRHEPAVVELSMTAPGPLSIRSAMKQMRVLAQAFGYSIPAGRVVAAVRGHLVTAAFSIEPAV